MSDKSGVERVAYNENRQKIDNLDAFILDTNLDKRYLYLHKATLSS